MLPVSPPATVGENSTLKVALWPAPSVIGVVIPLIPKPVPEIWARLIVRFVFPLFVSFTLCVLLWPTVTFPKPTDAGDIARPACVPVPVSEIERGELEASLVTVKVPLTADADCGAN